MQSGAVAILGMRYPHVGSCYAEKPGVNTPFLAFARRIPHETRGCQKETNVLGVRYAERNAKRAAHTYLCGTLTRGSASRALEMQSPPRPSTLFERSGLFVA